MENQHQQQIVQRLQLTTPFTAQVIGATLSGKTRLCHNIIQYANQIFDPPFKKIIYCYGEPQQIFLDNIEQVKSR